jgi:hypothetical protein
MKKIRIITAIIVLLLASIIYAIVADLVDTKHKYAISYSHGHYPMNDYTDTFQVTNGSVQYIDEHGIAVVRYGTFTIQKNSDYKK